MTSRLLPAGLAIFGVGVAVNYFGGETLKTFALGIQLVGVALLFANAGRSRRRAMRAENHEGE